MSALNYRIIKDCNCTPSAAPGSAFTIGSDRLFATRSADQAGALTGDTITWDEVTVSGTSIVDPGDNSGVYTIATAGVYLISANVYANPGAFSVNVNGVAVNGVQTDQRYTSIVRVLSLTDGDTVTVNVQANNYVICVGTGPIRLSFVEITRLA